MDECKVCANADNEYCFACDNGNHFKPKTNADRIRSMTDEELAELFWIRADCNLCPNRKRYCSDDCKGAWLKWLHEEVKND